jgi:hypothetical protein
MIPPPRCSALLRACFLSGDIRSVELVDQLVDPSSDVITNLADAPPERLAFRVW